ncbi:MAG TPA: twin-arginine translocation signal domain-containing protein [Persephonella sp.]|nr:twin-arginine translocation signal domain-containing protein [Persephonella sp.]
MRTTRRDFLKGVAAALGGVAVAKGVVEKINPSAVAEDNTDITFTPSRLDYYPPFEKWNDWKEPDGDYWKKHGGALREGVKLINYMIIPTVCNNCEAACGLTAWVDKDNLTVKKFMGNPFHSGSRGRNCAKGYATLAQMYDPDRIPFPLKRAPGSKRGEGRWVRTTWDEALETIGKKMRDTIKRAKKEGDELAKKMIMYHVGRPNESGGFTARVVWSWGGDYHNSHTNICSAGGRLGGIAWSGDDRPSPDFENARLIFLSSSHAADAGHYFQQHAGYIADARAKGARLVVMDPRLSNSAGMSDLWLPVWPGTEAAVYLSMISRLLQEDKYNRKFMERWVNWKTFLKDKEYLNYLLREGRISKLPEGETFDDFINVLKDLYKDYTFEWASQETKVPIDRLEKLYELILWAGDRITTYFWRAQAAGNRGGWMSAGRTGYFLLIVTGSIGGIGANGWHHWHVLGVGGKGGKATLKEKPDPVDAWNELLWPPEWPLSTYELSFLLPHLLSDDQWRKKWEERGLKIPDRLDVWISKIYNPVWINPDGFKWIEVLKDENKMGLTVNLSPTWSETNWFVDYILPVGLAGERHDNQSAETKPERWTAFRQPVLRVALKKMGWEPKVPWRATLEAHKKAGLGEVWEENEFWINLAWAIDPDGDLGIRQLYESKKNPGKPVTIEEWYNAAFESLPNLKKVCEKLGVTPYEYMRDRGAWTEETQVYNVHEREIPYDPEKDAYKYKGKWIPRSKLSIDPDSGAVYIKGHGDNLHSERHTIGVMKDGKLLKGFHTPTGLLEFYSKTFVEFNWPEYAIPYYPKNKEERQKLVHVVTHVHHDYMKEPNAFVLNPIYRLPYNIHTRSVNAKWLMEISQNHNPVWIYEGDAKKLGIKKGDPIKVRVVDTVSGIEVGYFVGMAVPTQATRPGVLACSHHSGRWRVRNYVKVDGFNQDLTVMSYGSALAQINNPERHIWTVRWKDGVFPHEVERKHSEKWLKWPYPEFNKDIKEVWWNGASGVWQNAVFPANPDPLSGMHCWHKKVLVEKAGPDDKIGDVVVNTEATFKVYQAWRDRLTRPAPGPNGLRRPKWFKRPWYPHTDKAYRMTGEHGE